MLNRIALGESMHCVTIYVADEDIGKTLVYYSALNFVTAVKHHCHAYVLQDLPVEMRFLQVRF